MNLIMVAGADKTYTLTIVDSSETPAALDEIWFNVGGLFQKSLGSGVTVEDFDAGTTVATVTIDPADTEGVSQRTAYPWIARVKLADGSIIPVLRGRFVIVAEPPTH